MVSCQFHRLQTFNYIYKVLVKWNKIMITLLLLFITVFQIATQLFPTPGLNNLPFNLFISRTAIYQNPICFCFEVLGLDLGPRAFQTVL